MTNINRRSDVIRPCLDPFIDQCDIMELIMCEVCENFTGFSVSEVTRLHESLNVTVFIYFKFLSCSHGV